MQKHLNVTKVTRDKSDKSDICDKIGKLKPSNFNTIHT